VLKPILALGTTQNISTVLPYDLEDVTSHLDTRWSFAKRWSAELYADRVKAKGNYPFETNRLQPLVRVQLPKGVGLYFSGFRYEYQYQVAEDQSYKTNGFILGATFLGRAPR
jgi:hypothetical protein